MKYGDFRQEVCGKEGNIFICRHGAVTVYEVGKKTYLLNNKETVKDSMPVIENPPNEFWADSIDWAGSYSDYWFMSMWPSETSRYVYKNILEQNINGRQRRELQEKALRWVRLMEAV